MNESIDVLLLCGYFEAKYQEEISRKTKTWVENAANTFQGRLIEGLKTQTKITLQVVSAPFIGPWPTAYKDVTFKGFNGEIRSDNIHYAHFCNIWGYRNISRAVSLKRYVKEFVKRSKNGKKAIIVYCPHTPFLEAAVYGKHLDNSIHIHLVVPDLPQYMNLSKRPHPVYDFFKRIDIIKMEGLIKKVDSFMLLTKYMADKLHVGNRPYIVVEGITSEQVVPERLKRKQGKKVAYAGKLVEAFGVKRLIEAFELIEDPEVSLHICGGGELKPYVEKMSTVDTRIHYYGVVSSEMANTILREADVLVNPRQNDDEYTKYSFPSKNIEYLMTGNAVVAYMLDGVPKEYKNFLIIPENNEPQALSDAIIMAISESHQTRDRYFHLAKKYFEKETNEVSVAKKILDFISNN